jgi:hypothetical protein
MAAMRVPLWLQIGWTIWAIAWVPFYWTQYGLQDFLFFCDLGNLLLMLALWLESPLIFSWQATGLLLLSLGPRGADTSALEQSAQKINHLGTVCNCV